MTTSEFMGAALVAGGILGAIFLGVAKLRNRGFRQRLLEKGFHVDQLWSGMGNYLAIDTRNRKVALKSGSREAIVYYEQIASVERAVDRAGVQSDTDLILIVLPGNELKEIAEFRISIIADNGSQPCLHAFAREGIPEQD